MALHARRRTCLPHGASSAQAHTTPVTPESMAEGPGGHSRRPLSLPPLTFGGLQALGARGLEAAQGPLDHLLVLDLHHLGGVSLVVFGACREDLPCSAARHLPGEPQAQPSPTHHAAEGVPILRPLPQLLQMLPTLPSQAAPSPKGTYTVRLPHIAPQETPNTSQHCQETPRKPGPPQYHPTRTSATPQRPQTPL